MEKGLVSIDRWGDGSQAYFLTHLHADHTKGLSSNWSKGALYCSSISAKLLPSKFPGFNPSLFRILEIGVTELVILHSPSSGSEVHLFVTPIDAAHCPGAVMYLFRGEFGCVLHTGDFRWEIMNERAVMAKKTLVHALDGHKVDVLYLDNTYCHPSFSFPSREVATKQVIDIIKSNSCHEIIIGIDTLGKEDLLLHISRALGLKIWVWPERLKTMHLLGFHNTFTTNTSLTRVRAVPRYSFTGETLAALNAFHPTIGILPSGVPYRAKFLNDDIRRNDKLLHQYAHSVQYSEHSCFSEIKQFVQFIRPSKIIGLVSSLSSSSSSYQIDPRCYFDHSSGNEQPENPLNAEQKRERLLICKRCFKWKNTKSERRRVQIVRRRGNFGAKLVDDDQSVEKI